MTATTFRQMTARSVEAAEPLAFPEPAATVAPPAFPQRAAVVRLVYHGAPVELTLNNRKIAEIEELIDSLLNRAGWELPATPTAQAPAVKAPRPAELSQEPYYGPDGTPCCPIHKKPLKAGQHGSYCSSKAVPPIGNDKGYCRYSWKED